MSIKRKTAVKTIIPCFKDNDILIFLGAGLCKEAYNYDRDGNFYIKEDNSNGLLVALGIAMNTNKRVFVFCNDSDLLKSIGSMLNVAVSECRNIFIIIFSSGKYQESGGQPTIFNNISAPKNILFSMGFLIFDYTQYLKNKSVIKELKQLIERTNGPAAALIKISPGISKEGAIFIDNKLLVDRIKVFIQNTNIGTSLYRS